MIYKIKETYEIIRGYRESTYEVEANSYNEAVDKINNGEIDPIDSDLDIRDTEFLNREQL